MAISDYLVDNVPEGPPSLRVTILLKDNASAAEYLVSNGTGQWIPNPEAFSQFVFKSAKVVVVPNIVIEYVPNGPDVG